MRVLVVTIALGVGSVATALGQQTETWLTRLGADTVALERFSRTKNRLDGELVVIAPKVRITKYTVLFHADGTVRRYQLSGRPGVGGSGAQPSVEATAAFGGGTITASVTRDAKTDTSRVAAGAGALPNTIYAWGLFGLATQAARRTRQDSVVLEQYGIGAKQVSKTAVVRRGDSVAVDFFGLPMMAKTDPRGRLLGVDGGRTTVKVLAGRVTGLDLAGLTASFIARERAGQAIGVLSSRDTVTAQVGAAAIWIDYGRPAKRGRQLLGGIVPYGEVWRTGANAATQFRVNREIELAGQPIPAGLYSLWTVPTPTGVSLVINRQAGQWGTEFDPAQDLGRYPLVVRPLQASVERFTISVADLGGAGEIRFDWGEVRWVAPFRVP